MQIKQTSPMFNIIKCVQMDVHLIYENKLEFSESTYDISQQAFIYNSILQHLVWIEFHNGKISLAGVSGSSFMSQNSMYLV